MVGKLQRIRDPIHGVIRFDESEFEQLIWQLINSYEFQRLRRIKQLGFSEFVFPGATHTRFAHSIGVFQTARDLVQEIKRIKGETEEIDKDRKKIVLCAALLHDLGHGPFSHTFEGVLKQIDRPKKHELWTADIIKSDETEVGKILAKYSADFRKAVSDVLSASEPTDIFSSIVSSQFDADRSDYLRRDRRATGVKDGNFDWEWLRSNLMIREISIQIDDQPVKVDAFCLDYKALRAAEDYLIGRLHLHQLVYLHKTTRGLEKMLGRLLELFAKRVSEGKEVKYFNLEANNPLWLFFKMFQPIGEHPEFAIAEYCELDDSVVWNVVRNLGKCRDKELSALANALKNRDIYKCVPVSDKFSETCTSASLVMDEVAKFKEKLEELVKSGQISEENILVDEDTYSAYKIHTSGEKNALEKIQILQRNGNNLRDIRDVSHLIEPILDDRKLYRVYARDSQTRKKLLELLG